MFFGRREDEDKRMVKLEFSKTIFLGHIFKKNQHIHFWFMVIPFGPHLVYT